jgi:hypothetical protein
MWSRDAKGSTAFVCANARAGRTRSTRAATSFSVTFSPLPDQDRQ